MRHVLVPRAVLALSALLLAASLLFARCAAPPPRGPDAPPPDAAALFAAHCAGCHEVDLLLPPLRAAPSRAAATADLILFLADHAAADDLQDALLAADLAGRAWR